MGYLSIYRAIKGLVDLGKKEKKYSQINQILKKGNPVETSGVGGFFRLSESFTTESMKVGEPGFPALF